MACDRDLARERLKHDEYHRKIFKYIPSGHCYFSYWKIKAIHLIIKIWCMFWEWELWKHYENLSLPPTFDVLLYAVVIP